jgi:hypothetical protein
MALQSIVALNQGFGVVGEIQFEGPTRAQPGVTKVGTSTAGGADIVVGRAFTIDAADGLFQPGGTGVFGGILSNPKGLSSIGTAAGGPLAPTLTVPAGTAGEFLTMGEILVSLPAAAPIGSLIYFVNATGVLGVGTAAGGQTQIANATVKRYANTAAGLAVVSFTGP